MIRLSSVPCDVLLGVSPNTSSFHCVALNITDADPLPLRGLEYINSQLAVNAAESYVLFGAVAATMNSLIRKKPHSTHSDKGVCISFLDQQ